MLTLDETFPRLFCATHRYSPLSALFTFVIINCSLLFVKEILELPLVFSGDRFMIQRTDGVGSPSTIQDIVTPVPSTGLVCVELMCGSSKSVIIRKKTQAISITQHLLITASLIDSCRQLSNKSTSSLSNFSSG